MAPFVGQAQAHRRAEGDEAVSDTSSACEDDTRGLLANVALGNSMYNTQTSVECEHHACPDIERGRDDGGSTAEEDLEVEEELAYSAAHLTSILKPVTATMVLVILIIKVLLPHACTGHIIYKVADCIDCQDDFLRHFCHT